MEKWREIGKYVAYALIGFFALLIIVLVAVAVVAIISGVSMLLAFLPIILIIAIIIGIIWLVVQAFNFFMATVDFVCAAVGYAWDNMLQ